MAQDQGDLLGTNEAGNDLVGRRRAERGEIPGEQPRRIRSQIQPHIEFQLPGRSANASFPISAKSLLFFEEM